MHLHAFNDKNYLNSTFETNLMNKVKNKSLKNKSLLYLKLSILIGEFLNLKNKILILNNLQPPKVM